MAFIRKQGQGVQMNEPAYPVSGGMLGSGEATGKKQSTDAGQPGGWTNIQDYLTANKSDQTNLNMAKQKSQEKIQQGASNIATQTQNLTALPTANTYDRSKINEALSSDQYDILSKGLSQQEARNQLSALPTVEQEIAGYAPIEKGVANVNPQDFQSSMEFIGSLAPQSPNYSAGQQSFDTMLLQGSPEFKTSFVPTMNNQFNQYYKEPLQQAREARTTARTQALEPIEKAGQDWKAGIQRYLGEEEANIGKNLTNQQQHYNNLLGDANADINARIQSYTQATGQAPSQDMIRTWERGKEAANLALGKKVESVFDKYTLGKLAENPQFKNASEDVLKELESGAWKSPEDIQNLIDKGFISKNYKTVYTGEPTKQAPNDVTALNEYLKNSPDKTKMNDLMALYNMLGITPKYTAPTADTQYDYSALI